MEELEDLVAEVFVELEPAVGDALLEAAGPALEHLQRVLRVLELVAGLRAQFLDHVAFGEQLVQLLRLEGEQVRELVPGPLDGVLDLVGEALQCTEGHVLLRRVPPRAVRLGEEGHDHLRSRVVVSIHRTE